MDYMTYKDLTTINCICTRPSSWVASIIIVAAKSVHPKISNSSQIPSPSVSFDNLHYGHLICIITEPSSSMLMNRYNESVHLISNSSQIPSPSVSFRQSPLQS